MALANSGNTTCGPASGRMGQVHGGGDHPLPGIERGWSSPAASRARPTSRSKSGYASCECEAQRAALYPGGLRQRPLEDREDRAARPRKPWTGREDGRQPHPANPALAGAVADIDDAVAGTQP